MSLPFNPQPPASPQGYNPPPPGSPQGHNPNDDPSVLQAGKTEVVAGTTSAGYGIIGWLGTAAPFVFLYVWSMTHDEKVTSQGMILPTLALLFGAYGLVSSTEQTTAKMLGRYIVRHNKVRPGGALGQAAAMAVAGIGSTISLASIYPDGPSGSFWPALIGYALSWVVAFVVAMAIWISAATKA